MRARLLWKIAARVWRGRRATVRDGLESKWAARRRGETPARKGAMPWNRGEDEIEGAAAVWMNSLLWPEKIDGGVAWNRSEGERRALVDSEACGGAGRRW